MDADTRDRWLTHMRTVVDDLHLPHEHEAPLWEYLQRTAFSLTPVTA